MLHKVNDNRIESFENLYKLNSEISIFARVLSIKKPDPGRAALFLHGGGVTGNHTLSERPSRWLLSNGVFDTIIIPDRRGAGLSSSFNRLTSLRDQSQDMKLLLDQLHLTGPVTVIAASYGGPIALLLASIDSRISKVILLASSPVMILTEKKLKLVHRLGLDRLFSKMSIELFTGNSNKSFVDMDFVYDVRSSIGLVIAQIRILRQMNRRLKLKSLKLMVDSVFEKENIFITDELKLDVPVLQVIGENDNVWKSRLQEKHMRNFPLLKQIIIPKAKHRDLFLRADEFLQTVKLSELP